MPTHVPSCSAVVPILAVLIASLASPLAGQDALHDTVTDTTHALFSPHEAQAFSRPQPHMRNGRAQTTTPLVRQSARYDRVLTHRVFGYHPYWIADSVTQNYRFDRLTHLAYFSAEVDAPSGELITTRGWLTAPVVDRALAAGIEVQLAVTNFGSANNRSLLQSTAARDTLVSRLIEMVRLRGAHGLAIDFESVPGDQRENLTAFFAALRGRLHAAIPGARISAAVPAVDWNDAWDAEALAPLIDLVFVMCYDYSWSGSSTAGPVSPLQGMSYHVRRSLETWLQNGIPPERLLMGIPYYGYDWPVVSDAPRAATTGRATARTYSYISGMLQRYSRQWSTAYLNPWFPYQVADWRQVWYDDAESLDYKYRLVPELRLAGIGIWALGYDADLPELWNEIEEHFTRTTTVESVGPAGPGQLSVSPQPARAGEGLSLHISGGTPRGSAEISLHDILGRSVWNTRRDAMQPFQRIQLPRLKFGTYLLRVKTSTDLFQRRIIVFHGLY